MQNSGLEAGQFLTLEIDALLCLQSEAHIIH